MKRCKKFGLIFTEHALERAKTRCNMKGTMAQHMSLKAYNLGIGIEKAKVGLKSFLKYKYGKYKSANNIRIYGHFVFVFKNNILITIFNLPEQLKIYWNEYSKELKELELV